MKKKLLYIVIACGFVITAATSTPSAASASGCTVWNNPLPHPCSP
ncbi:hypothetical protein ACFFHH_12590 [Cytobacillus solani]|nr:hypothetical protein [Cytobacillus solani]